MLSSSLTGVISCAVRETLASAVRARSIRVGDTVTVADMVMQRIVDPPHAGSNPVSHLLHSQALTQCPGYSLCPFPQVHMRDEGFFVSRDP